MPPQTETSSELQEPLLTSHSDDHTPLATTNEAAPHSETNPEIPSKNIVLPLCGGRSHAINHNVFLNLVIAVMYGISGSLWNGTAYVAYLKQLGHNQNGPLGDIEAVSGLATLLTALPVGYLADKWGRAKVIRAGGVLLIFTALLQIGVLQWVGTDMGNANDHQLEEEEESIFWPMITMSPAKRTNALWLMGVIMAFWGVGDGVVNGPCAALYADSTPEGERSTYYNYLFACYSTATAAGPLVSIILFQTLGDDWDLYDLRVVIYVGLGMEFVNALLMMMLDDRKALDESSSSETSENENDNGDSDPVTRNDSVEPERITDNTDTSLQKRREWIPYIVFANGLILALGSGMTVKFFPLFFKDEVGMSPSQVQIIYVTVPIVMVITATLGSKLSNSGFGRVQTTLLLSCLGVSCLYIMVFFKSYLDLHPALLVPIYVLRTSLMNAPYPLQESILMDYVPKQVRARWKSLDSVASFGWCGSAALGGVLADKYDYTFTFLITAILQSLGIAVWCLLLPLVPRQEGSGWDTSRDGSEDLSVEQDTVLLQGPTTETVSFVTSDTAIEEDNLREPLVTASQ